LIPLGDIQRRQGSSVVNRTIWLAGAGSRSATSACVEGGNAILRTRLSERRVGTFVAIMRRPDMGSVLTRVKDTGPQPQSFDIERATKENTNYRSVAWSGRYLQVTLMSIPVGGSIGLEAHPQTDQFLRLDAGHGLVQMGAAKDKLTFEKEVSNGWCVLVPAGTWHNITNTGTTPMQVYAIYAPAHHAPDKVQATAAAAKADEHDEPAAWSEQPKHLADKHG
jgi:mannose-6-phosphate isomerase-like protein (cupin superfamily)